MNRPSYKELWLDERKDRDEQLQWIRDAVDGNAKFCSSEPPYSEEEELARQVMTMHTRIAKLGAVIEILEDQQREAKNILIDKNLHIDSLYEEGYKLQQRIAELEGKIDQLTAHDATERQDDKWIPVSERLPENWESVLTIDISKSTQDVVSAFYNPVTSLWSTHFLMYSDSDLWVTHWMPLPEPPIVYGKVCEE